MPGPVVFGGLEGEVEVEPGPEDPEPEGVVDVDVELVPDPFGVVEPVVGVPEGFEGVEGVDVVAGVEVVVGAGGQDSDTDLTGTERLRVEIGAPGGSWKYSVWPVTSVTVTVQLAAEAAGSAATPNTAAIRPSVMSATFSFPRLNTVAVSPPDVSRAALRPRDDQTTRVSQASY